MIPFLVWLGIPADAMPMWQIVLGVATLALLLLVAWLTGRLALIWVLRMTQAEREQLAGARHRAAAARLAAMKTECEESLQRVRNAKEQEVAAIDKEVRRAEAEARLADAERVASQAKGVVDAQILTLREQVQSRDLRLAEVTAAKDLATNELRRVTEELATTKSKVTHIEVQYKGLLAQTQELESELQAALAQKAALTGMDAVVQRLAGLEKLLAARPMAAPSSPPPTASPPPPVAEAPSMAPSALSVAPIAVAGGDADDGSKVVLGPDSSEGPSLQVGGGETGTPIVTSPTPVPATPVAPPKDPSTSGRRPVGPGRRPAAS